MSAHINNYLACTVLVALACGCSSGPSVAVGVSAEESAIRDADAAWLKALDARQVDSAMSFYADDASVLGPNAPVMTGKDAIRKFWSDQFAPAVALKLS